MIAVLVALFFAIVQVNWIIAIAVIMTLVAVVFTGVALLCDILLFLKVQKQVHELGSGVTAAPGVGESYQSH
jgi:membrane protein YdbS with pleckstrin-like domain